MDKKCGGCKQNRQMFICKSCGLESCFDCLTADKHEKVCSPVTVVRSGALVPWGGGEPGTKGKV